MKEEEDKRPFIELSRKERRDKARKMVFGDYNNDLEMLGKAKYSFAMENAHANVLEAASYKTTSNDNYGVENILKKMLYS